MRAVCLLMFLCASSTIMGEVIEFREMAKGAMSGFNEPTRLVITNQAEWEKVWQKHNIRRTPVPEVPKVDFEKEMVLLVAMGMRNTGGYSIAIARIEKEEGRMVVHVDTKSPPPGAITLQALTAPFHVVAAKSRELPVVFKVDGKIEKPTKLPGEQGQAQSSE